MATVNYKKPDYWSIKAHHEGFPARSVYKLKEMDEKFSLLKSSGRPLNVLDLGAAPGSWSLYVSRQLKTAVNLTAVDLIPLSSACVTELTSGTFSFIAGDMTAVPVRDNVAALGPFDIVISDAAPTTTGNSLVDTLRSLALAETALEYAALTLAPSGNFVVKIFQGGDTAPLLKQIRTLFTSGKPFKPRACRNESIEMYYIGLGRLKTL
jgi:23S rRNA (uridine2552-2'-O)-methyltransferase